MKLQWKLLIFVCLAVGSLGEEDCNVLPTPRARRLCRERSSKKLFSDDLTADDFTDNDLGVTDGDGFGEGGFGDDVFSPSTDFDAEFGELSQRFDGQASPTIDASQEQDVKDTFDDIDKDNFGDIDKDNFDDIDFDLGIRKPNQTKKIEPEIYIEEVTQGDFYDDDLIDCKDLDPEIERKPSVNCKEVKKPIIRWRDPVFERLLPQVWRDYQKKMRFDRELYGMVIEPLIIGDFAYSDSSFAHSLDLDLRNITIHGLSSIYLSKTLVTRARDLSDLNMLMAFKFEELVVNGSYTSAGWFGWNSLDSGGLQNFEIKLTNATVTPTLMVNSTEENKFGCGEGGGSVVLDIAMPITWSNLYVEFDNIGSVVNSIINIAAVAMINSQEKNLIGLMKDKIKEEVNSLICPQDM
eukprot:TRINITY_DN14353_c0_g1_i1.p1 TRINITY_DN14353_c0_g1~~TRINITY_DN14353_c0_g1_i1.p1  ORF type:complete len:408 (+),score=95.79 TRINITY_DN14353_c0_g1_i1:87-1310(+)